MRDSLNLSPKAIRRIANLEGYREAYFNEVSRVISFAKPGERLHRIRINVYYTTGTVGTCINHPRMGRTQLFRRNADIVKLAEIFRNPRVHTRNGYRRLRSVDDTRLNDSKSVFPIGSRVYVDGYANCTVMSGLIRSFQHPSLNTDDGLIKVKYDNGKTYHVPMDQLMEVQEEVREEKLAIQQQIEALLQDKKLIDQELSELRSALVDDGIEKGSLRKDGKETEEEPQQREREEKRRQEKMNRERPEKERNVEVKSQEKDHEKKEEIESHKKAKEEFTRQWIKTLATRIVNRGIMLHCNISQGDAVREFFSKESVTSISCAAGATIMLYETGGWNFTPGIPKSLYNILDGRSLTSALTLPKPNYVAIGTMGRFFIKFDDGNRRFTGSDKMEKVLLSASKEVASVAFGQKWNSFAIVYTDGSYVCNDIPIALDNLVRVRRQNKPDIICISLGPNGEYYVLDKTGGSWLGGVTDVAREKISRYAGHVKFVDFSDDDEYILRYT